MHQVPRSLFLCRASITLSRHICLLLAAAVAGGCHPANGPYDVSPQPCRHLHHVLMLLLQAVEINHQSCHVGEYYLEFMSRQPRIHFN